MYAVIFSALIISLQPRF